MDLTDHIELLVDTANANFLAGMKASKPKLFPHELDRIAQIRKALVKEMASGTNISFYESVFFLRIIDRLTK